MELSFYVSKCALEWPKKFTISINNFKKEMTQTETHFSQVNRELSLKLRTLFVNDLKHKESARLLKSKQKKFPYF